MAFARHIHHKCRKSVDCAITESQAVPGNANFGNCGEYTGDKFQSPAVPGNVLLS